MMRRLILAALLATMASAARAQDAPAASPLLLRLTIAPARQAWVGQRIAVTLTAMTPVRFAEPPVWPDLTTSQGRMIVLPDASTVPGTERVQGASYAALQRTYSVIAAEAGELVIAPVAMTVRAAGPDGQTIEASATTVAMTLTARLPPGVTDVARLVVSPRFRMTSTLEGHGGDVHVGDAVIRLLRLEADDTASMMLPPGLWPAPDGMRVYPDPPVLQDRSDRGTLHALRSERVAFVPERLGNFELPGFSVIWFEPRSGRTQTVRVDPLQVNALPPAGAAVASASSPVWPWLVGVSGLLIVVGAALWFFRGARRARPAQPIVTLRAACRAGDAKTALVALYRWCDATLPPGGERTIAALSRRTAEPALAEQARLLEAKVLDGDTAGWDGRELVAAARTVERKMHCSWSAMHSAALPALNPVVAAQLRPRLAEPRWIR